VTLLNSVRPAYRHEGSAQMFLVVPAHAAPLHGCKYRWLHAPATNFIWTKRPPVSGDLLLSLAALSIPAGSPFNNRPPQPKILAGKGRRVPTAFSLYGRPERGREVPPQLDAEFLSVRRWSLHDGGRFTMPPGLTHRRILFVAGGTGIAPVRSMPDHARRRHPSAELALLDRARSADELVVIDDWRALAAAGRPALHATITRSDGSWTGCRGRLGMRQFRAYVSDPMDTRCFVCGPLSFVQDLVAALVALGVPADAVSHGITST
jgi:hypothetical protein